MRRAVLLLPLACLAWFLTGAARNCWVAYWLSQDAQTGSALITGKAWSGHGIVEYEYKVGDTTYSGRGHRNTKFDRYRQVGVGGKSIVYYSRSHPSLSSLDEPSALGGSWVAVLFAAVIGSLLVTTIVNPNGRWALRGFGQPEPGRSS